MVRPQGAPESSDPPAPQDQSKAAAQATPPKAKLPPPKGYAHLFKYVIVGDSGAGKTALIRRFSKDLFEESRDYTIGIDFDVKTMALPNGDEVKLQMWDTAGQERYRTITTSYYRGAHAVIVAYDVNDKESFDNVRQWIQEVRRYCNDDALLVVVGCKTDIKSESGEFFGKEKMKEELESYGISEVFGLYEASAKTGEGVQQVFQAMTEELITQRLNERNPLRAGKSIKLGKGHEAIGLLRAGHKPKSRCC